MVRQDHLHYGFINLKTKGDLCASTRKQTSDLVTGGIQIKPLTSYPDFQSNNYVIFQGFFRFSIMVNG